MKQQEEKAKIDELFNLVRMRLPEFVRMCQEACTRQQDSMILHQDMIGARHDYESYILVGMAIVYAMDCNLDVLIHCRENDPKRK